MINERQLDCWVGKYPPEISRWIMNGACANRCRSLQPPFILQLNHFGSPGAYAVEVFPRPDAPSRKLVEKVLSLLRGSSRSILNPSKLSTRTVTDAYP